MIALAFAPAAALAQNYPTKPIRLIVPSAAGGSVDMLARTVGGKLGERWNQQVVVDNRAGAGGVIAAEITAKAPPDGYTLIIGTVASMAANVSLTRNLSYHPLRDFAPVTLVATQPFMLLVNPSLPVKSVKEFVALAKAKPGYLTFSSAGQGTGGHLSAELLKLMAGIDLLHIPYKGSAAAQLDVITGQVSCIFLSIASSLGSFRSGKLRGIAVTGPKRAAAAPDVPTMMESGIANYQSETWYGILAPVATPRTVVIKLSREIADILKQPDLKRRLSAEGVEPVGNSPDEFTTFIRSEIDKWSKVAKAAGIKPE